MVNQETNRQLGAFSEVAKMRLLALLIFALSATTLSAATINLNSGDVITLRGDTITCNATPPAEEPTTTRKCERRNGVGDCTEYTTTYHMRTASCTEDCARRNGIGECTERNECTYEGNGCFIKKSCGRRDGVGRCVEIQEDAICR